ncbi:translation protein SH3-like domain-containing protein [Xylariaceae sp. FL1272]|nr:translation protein SH3-like domain-containing protein [Xylariaceae sp. FL1272]
MLTQPAWRPLAAWKGALRTAGHQRPTPLLRSMATETTPTTTTASSSIPPPMRPRRTKKPEPPRPLFEHEIFETKQAVVHDLKSTNPLYRTRSKFAVYAQNRSFRFPKRHPEALVDYHAQQVKRLDPKSLRTHLFSKSNPDSVKPGDVLQVTTKRGEPFSGVVLSIRRAGVDTAILLRNHLMRMGVEMWYKIYSPNILGMEIIWRRPKRARRARLTYMRQPKHDMGSVAHLVDAWRKTRNVFSSKGGKQGNAAGQKGKKGRR